MIKTVLIQAILFFLLATLSACAPKSPAGFFSNSLDKNQIRFAGKELILGNDGSFIHNEWTDSYGMNKDENGELNCFSKPGKGTGTYQIKNDTLELLFTNNDFLTAQFEIKETANSYDIVLTILDELETPLIGEAVYFFSKKRAVIATILTDTFGKAIISIDKTKEPHTIGITPFAGEQFFLNMLENIGTSEHHIKRCIGYYKNQAIEKMWFSVKRRYIEYQKPNRKLIRLKRMR